MAERARNVSKKVKEPVLEDPKLVRHERLTLILYLEMGLAIIAGMVVLSQFLSQGHVSKPVWVTGAILGGIALIFFGVTFFMRRAADKTDKIGHHAKP